MQLVLVREQEKQGALQATQLVELVSGTRGEGQELRQVELLLMK